MSNFGAKLAELLERNRKIAADLSRASGINDGLLSKWINGHQTFVSADDLASICIHISTIPKERAELVKAHLLDELGGAPGSELISVTIKGQTSYNDPPPSFHDALPLQLRRDLELLGREAVTDTDVRACIRGLANILSSGATTANSENTAAALNETADALTAAAKAGAQQSLPRKAQLRKQTPRVDLKKK